MEPGVPAWRASSQTTSYPAFPMCLLPPAIYSAVIFIEKCCQIHLKHKKDTFLVPSGSRASSPLVTEQLQLP